jgi:hypothetical protein
MELHEVPRTTKGTWVRVLKDENGPPDSLDFQADDLVLYFHVDGMYSYCRNQGGDVVYLKAWTEVEIVEDGPTKE